MPGVSLVLGHRRCRRRFWSTQVFIQFCPLFARSEPRAAVVTGISWVESFVGGSNERAYLDKSALLAIEDNTIFASCGTDGHESLLFVSHDSVKNSFALLNSGPPVEWQPFNLHLPHH